MPGLSIVRRARVRSLTHAIVAILAFAPFPPAAAQAPTGRIVGRIIDASTGQGLADVGIQVVGTTLGTSSGVDGRYVLPAIAAGTVTLRARFPNAQGLLLPGMFVTALFSQGIEPNVFLIPQAALQRDIGGDAFVFIIGKDNKAERRKVAASRTYGADWVVSSGLKAGDKVITQGTANLRSGAPLRPVPATAPQKIAPRPPGERGGGGRGGRS